MDQEEGVKPWYDSMEGVARSLGSLEDFHRLDDARREAWQDRRELLGEFVVFGRFFLDEGGSLGHISVRDSEGFVEMLSNAPEVLTGEEFRSRLEEHGSPLWFRSSSPFLPPVHIRCPECGQGWSIRDCHEVSMYHTRTLISLSDFVSKTLGEVRRAFAEKTHASYFLQSDCPVRHGEDGAWLDAPDGIDDSYIVAPGDIGYFNMRVYEHPACRDQRLERELRQQFEQIFEDAGFLAITLEAVKSEYGSGDYNGPWFLVHTSWGVIRVGWRRRVIEIVWDQLDVVDTEHLFDDEHVTKGEHMIRARGVEKARDYLSRIRSVLT